MTYRVAAAAVLFLHLAFILFVMGGALLAVRRRWVLAVHLPAALWGVWAELGDAPCPLTGIENYLRMRGGLAGYREGFIEHYLLAAIYPSGLGRELQLLLAAVVLATNVVLYTLVLRRRGRGQTGSSEVPPAEEP
ncbi:DUF2784 domain-containing protein [Massilia solisilvae]|uniref:DUF2784 domain-containing protein n=1 Tax=Massilia solisilvae TaxID=1811225 RepID=A0ABT2BJI6_9BURK|nr:DUF2784 domain-containing protein [Massilia solisilvae]MCS0608073.1 DUF2784 domain-containing protein [Massilia solisilvae]